MVPQNKMIFCTLFDSNYLDKGLALYASMKKNFTNFKLYIFAFDNKCFNVLSDMQLENVIILSVDDIMTDALQQIRQERSRAEFCWTCTSVIIEYVLLRCKEEICTYIDADIYFFASPEKVIQEIIDNGCSVGLVEHRFERDYEYGSWIFTYGKYCIQFNTFLNNQEGMQVLREWKENCLNWCYGRYEDGKFGDQKYPDNWRQKFSCVHELQHLGMGVAPWNVHIYSEIERENGEIYVKFRGKKYKLIFYHFEGMKYLDHDRVYLKLWKSDKAGIKGKIKLLYGEYFATIAYMRKYLKQFYDITFEHLIIENDPWIEGEHSLKHFCREDGLLNGLKGWRSYWTNNIVTIDKMISGR